MPGGRRRIADTRGVPAAPRLRAKMPVMPKLPALPADNLLQHSVVEQARDVPAGWAPALEAASASLARVAAFVEQRRAAGAPIYPARLFRALEVEPRDVRVVILGQDPYHGPGQAQGLAFSVPDDCPPPPSLRNIFKELAADYPAGRVETGTAAATMPSRARAAGSDARSPTDRSPPGATPRPAQGELAFGDDAPPPAPAATPRETAGRPGSARPPGNDLGRWARQGVLLLNTVLTVEDGQPASHARQGWENVTDALIDLVARDPSPKVFMLWGAHAQAKEALVPPGRGHLVLKANHPSPLSARRPPAPFLGCGHFRQANEWLLRHGRPPVDWFAS